MKKCKLSLRLVAVLILFFYLFPQDVTAVTAYPSRIEYIQPDGTKLNIFLKGDEFIHWATTLDGYTILSNAQGFYEYASKDADGNLVFSGIRAHNAGERNSLEQQYLQSIKQDLFFGSAQIAAMKTWKRRGFKGSSGEPLLSGFPTSGTRKLLQILANFSNTTTTYTQTNFDNYMNQVNYNGTGSFRDFYLEVSYGQLTVNTTVTIWVTLPQTHDYYGPEAKWGEFAYDAVVAADQQASVDYSEYDNNNDGIVDGVAIIHQGRGQEESGNTNDIWSHSWDLASAGYSTAQRTFDGVQVLDYTVQPEKNGATSMTTIGVMCHEFGHNLGSPDFYDTDYGTGGEYDGTGDWDVMADGSWNGASGTKPAHHNAWTKSYFSWTSPVVMTTQQSVLLRNAQIYTDAVRYNTTTNNEYFLCENRQKTGFDVGLPGHGLIIYHVDGDYINAHSFANDINATSHQGLFPMSAIANTANGIMPSPSNINSGGCPWPGTGTKTTFTDATTPCSKSWSGANTGMPVFNISENTATKEISFCFISGLPVTVSIAATENPVCSGTTVTYTATPTNGGTSPSYQWKVNGSNVGTNSASYAYIPLNDDIVTCELTSSGSCVTGNPATSNSITMSVVSSLLVSVSIEATENPVCSGTPVTYTATPTNGGTNPSYQWKVNGTDAGTGATYAYTPTNNDIITCVLTSSGSCVIGNPATSNSITMSVVSGLPVSVNIAASENPVCTGTTVTYTATPTNGGTNPSYQWKVNGIITGTNNASHTYTPLNGDVVTCVLTSSGSCVTGNPATSNSITMSVVSSLPVSVSIEATENPVCSGTTVTYTATPTNGGASPSYQWKVNGSNVGTNSASYAYIPLNDDVVTCMLTSSGSCVTGNPATSNSITMSVVSSLPVSVTIDASENPVCAGTTVTYTATPTNGGTNPSYQWKVNGTDAGTGATYAYTPTNNDIITCVLTSSGSCVTGNPATSNSITMSVVSGLPVSVTIDASENPVCSETTVTYTATPTNGGTTPSYQWKVNGTDVGTGATYAYTPNNNDIITCVLTSNGSCVTGNPATSNSITMSVVSGLPVSVNIAASENPVCTGTPVTYTATPTNGGTNPSYQWKVNGSDAGTGATYAYTPNNNDIITCVLTSNGSCVTGNPATSNSITMSVVSSLPVSVTIDASENPVCTGTTVTYTATPTNGGTNPSYQWKVNGIITGTNDASHTYTPLNGDVVTCVLTSNGSCVTGNPATSNAVTMSVVSSLPVSVTVAASENPVCAGSTVTFTATPTNGGANPSYQWKVNGIDAGTGATYAYTPTNNDIITCVLTSSGSCVTGNPATSNAVTMSVVSSLPVSVTVAASENPVCAGTTVTYTATPVNGGTNPSYQWKVNGIDAGTGATYAYTPTNNDIITCVLTSSGSCVTGNPATSNSIIMSVVSSLPVSVTIDASENPVCIGTTVTYTATPTNGGTNPSYQWKVNGSDAGTGGTTYSYAPANNDIITCILTSNGSCVTGNPATSNTVTMSVVSSLPVSVSIAATENPVCAGTTVTYSASPVNGGANPSYQWKVNGTDAGTGTTYSYTPANNDIITCVLTSSGSCVTGNPATSNSITMSVVSSLPVSVSIAATENPVCTGTTVTYTATPVNGGTNPSYQWKVNGTDAGTGTTYSYTPANNDIITCVLNSNGSCLIGNPATSNQIVMSLIPFPDVIFTTCMDLKTTTSAQPYKLKGGLPLGGVYSGPGVNSTTGIFDPALAGSGNKTITYSYTNSYSCSKAVTQIIQVSNPASFTCGSSLVDIRDDQTYPTLLLPNGKCWMAANLNYGTGIAGTQMQTDNCTVEKYCPQDNMQSCDVYGGTYQWDELMSFDNTEGVQGLCPPGWHIPTSAEWEELVNFYGGSSVAGAILNDLYIDNGFYALHGGLFYMNNVWAFFSGVYKGSMYWTSTNYSTSGAISRGINYTNKSVSLYNSSRANAFYVRCLKN